MGVHFDSSTGSRPISVIQYPRMADCEVDEKYTKNESTSFSANLSKAVGLGVSRQTGTTKTCSSRILQPLPFGDEISDPHPEAYGFLRDLSNDTTRQKTLDSPDVFAICVQFEGPSTYSQGDCPDIPPLALLATSKLTDARSGHHLTRLPTIETETSLNIPDFSEAIRTGVANDFECTVKSNLVQDLALQQKGVDGGEPQWVVVNRQRNSVRITCEERHRKMFHTEERVCVVGGDEKGLSSEFFVI